jgi:hypothetical protein
MKKIAFRIHSTSAFGVSYPVCRFNSEPGFSPADWTVQPPYTGSPDQGFWQLVACPSNTASMDVSLGVANSAWEVALTLGTRHGGIAGDWSATCNSVDGPGDTVAVNFTYSPKPDWDTRMVAVHRDGKITVIPKNSDGTGSLQTGGLLVLSTNDFADITQFQLERRKYQWVEFRNVALQPNRLTVVGVKDATAGTERGALTVPHPTLATLAFGPVVERELQLFAPGQTNVFLRMKTGEFLTAPQTRPTAIFHAWLTNNVNLALSRVSRTGPGGWALFAGNMRLSDVSAKDWETATPIQVEAALSHPTSLEHPPNDDLSQQTYLLSDPAHVPLLAFSTTDGVGGLLQIIGINDNPPNARIRYKLVQPGHDAVQATTSGLKVTGSFLMEVVGISLLGAILYHQRARWNWSKIVARGVTRSQRREIYGHMTAKEKLGILSFGLFYGVWSCLTFVCRCSVFCYCASP